MFTVRLHVGVRAFVVACVVPGDMYGCAGAANYSLIVTCNEQYDRLRLRRDITTTVLVNVCRLKVIGHEGVQHLQGGSQLAYPFYAPTYTRSYDIT